MRTGGLDSIRFGWAGATEPRQPCYYRIQGPGFLIIVNSSIRLPHRNGAVLVASNSASRGSPPR